jgi:hypothetical protein
MNGHGKAICYLACAVWFLWAAAPLAAQLVPRRPWPSAQLQRRILAYLFPLAKRQKV